VALTTLLVMYTLFQSISNTLPQTAYLKLIDYWLIFSLVLPLVIFIVHVAWEIQRAKFNKKVRGTQTSRLPRPANGTIHSKFYVKTFLPSITVLFMIAYWFYALKVYNSFGGWVKHLNFSQFWQFITYVNYLRVLSNCSA